MSDVPDQNVAAFEQAIAQFNDRDFYACHDTLEAIWMDAFSPDRAFYQGLLQIAVGLYHLRDRNWRGATMLLGEGVSRLRHYQPTHKGLEVTQLMHESLVLLTELHKVGAEGLASILQDLETESHDLQLPKLNFVLS